MAPQQVANPPSLLCDRRSADRPPGDYPFFDALLRCIRTAALKALCFSRRIRVLRFDVLL